MNAEMNVTDALILFGERVFNDSPVRRTPGRRGMRALSMATGREERAAATRRRLELIAKRAPEVMVRISGGGRSIRHIKAHLDYISRKGEIELKDQNGEGFRGRDEVDLVRDDWAFGGYPIGDSGTRREAFNIILSMPAGTDERSLKLAAEQFAAEEFEGFQYVMAVHTMDTDPDPDPSPNPHAHLCVKATRPDGQRLNPRKVDLQRWRDRFAQHLREHGVEASASKRIHRLSVKRGEKQSVRHARERGDTLHAIGKSDPDAERVSTAILTASHLRNSFRDLALAMSFSSEPSDQRLASNLSKMAGEVMRDHEPMGSRQR